MTSGIIAARSWNLEFGNRCGQAHDCFEFGPKGLENLAQALAWVALFLRVSPVRAPENAGAIHIDRTRVQMTISSAPSGLIGFIVTPPRLKPGLSFQGPSGRQS